MYTCEHVHADQNSLQRSLACWGYMYTREHVHVHVDQQREACTHEHTRHARCSSRLVPCRLNYAWGVEFVELTNGNKGEQRRVGIVDANRDGLHGNALLSRWPLHGVSIVRIYVYVYARTAL